MIKSEVKRALLGAGLAPLAMILVFPIAVFSEAYFQRLENPAGLLPVYVLLGTYFAYLGMAIFSVPMYFVLRLIRQYHAACILISALVGAVAAIVTIPILSSSSYSHLDWIVLRADAMRLSFWVNSMSISGAFVGIAFLLIARPGPYLEQPADMAVSGPSTSL